MGGECSPPCPLQYLCSEKSGVLVSRARVNAKKSERRMVKSRGLLFLSSQLTCRDVVVRSLCGRYQVTALNRVSIIYVPSVWLV